MNKVKLSFDKDMSNLAGFEFGKSVYYNQVKGKIDVTKKFSFEFPPEITGVASSFVQGFFDDIVNEIGLLATEERAIIISDNKRIEETLLKKLQ